MECFLTKKIDVREAICALEQKINEVVAAYNEVAADQTEINKLIKELKAQIDYLLGAGLTKEVEKVLDKWKNDGTLADIINEEVFGELDNRVEVVENSVNNIVLYVKDFGAIGDGVADDTEAIQKAIGTDFTKYHTNQPLRTVIFERGKTYNISSTIFVPPYADIDFNGATIKAIAGGSFKNDYMFSVNSEDAKTWSFGYYPRVGMFTNGIIDGNDIKNIKGVFLCSNHRLTKLKFWKLYRSIYSPNVYIDNYFLEDIKINYPMGTLYQIEKAGQGDGIHISKIHTPSNIEELEYGSSLTNSGAPILCLKQCGGGVIENIINGRIEIRTSYALTISNLHLETGSLWLYDTNCSVRDSIIYKRNEITQPAIYLNDSNYGGVKQGSKPLILENVQILNYYKLSDYVNEVPDLDVSDFEGVVLAKNLNRRIANIGLVKTANCGISIKASNRTLLGSYDEYMIKNKKIIVSNDECMPTISDFIRGITLDENTTWKMPAGTYYYNACQLIDLGRKVGRISTNEQSYTANSNGCLLNLNTFNTIGVIRLYRGTQSKRYTHYVDIPTPIGIIFDIGVSANGFAWKTLEQPVSEADAQNNITGLINNGGWVIARGSSVPTKGKWFKGDVIINNYPSVQGEPGSKFIVSSWTCIADGTPGTWIANKTFTGE